MARRAEQTFIGSKDAFNTKTREFILKRKYILPARILSKISGQWPFYFRLSAQLDLIATGKVGC
jgi:hypothetical protein